jgi:hypothetical protein
VGWVPRTAAALVASLGLCLLAAAAARALAIEVERSTVVSYLAGRHERAVRDAGAYVQ